MGYGGGDSPNADGTDAIRISVAGRTYNAAEFVKWSATTPTENIGMGLDANDLEFDWARLRDVDNNTDVYEEYGFGEGKWTVIWIVIANFAGHFGYSMIMPEWLGGSGAFFKLFTGQICAFISCFLWSFVESIVKTGVNLALMFHEQETRNHYPATFGQPKQHMFQYTRKPKVMIN